MSVVSCLRISRFIYCLCLGFFCTLLGFYGLDMDGWYSVGINDYFRMLFGFVNSSELVRYLRVERYLAAKIGTISLGPLLVGRLYYVWLMWLYFSTGFCCLISAFIR